MKQTSPSLPFIHIFTWNPPTWGVAQLLGTSSEVVQAESDAQHTFGFRGTLHVFGVRHILEAP